MAAWGKVAQALAGSDRREDRRLAGEIVRYVRAMPAAIERIKKLDQQHQRDLPGMRRSLSAAPTLARESRVIER